MVWSPKKTPEKKSEKKKKRAKTLKKKTPNKVDSGGKQPRHSSKVAQSLSEHTNAALLPSVRMGRDNRSR